MGNSAGPCVFPFLYYGVNYSGCIVMDSGPNDPWCGTTSNYDRDTLYVVCDMPCLQGLDCGPLQISSKHFTIEGCEGTRPGDECVVTCANTTTHAYLGTPFQCSEDGLWVGLAVCFERSQTQLQVTQLSSSPGLALIISTDDGIGSPGNIALGSIDFSSSTIPAGLLLARPAEQIEAGVSLYRLYTGTVLADHNSTLDDTQVHFLSTRPRFNTSLTVTLPATTLTVSPALQHGRQGLLTIRGTYVESNPQLIIGGREPLQYTLFGNVPAGLALVAENQRVQLKGYPLVSGNFSNIVVEAQDRNGARVRLNALDLAIGEPMLLHWQPPAPALAAAAGRALVLALPPFTRTGGLGPLTLRIDGLPSGLRFNARTEEIVGSTSMPGAFNLTVWGTDSTGIGLRVGTLLLTITQAGAAEESLLASGAGIGVMAGCGVLLLGMAFWLHAHLTRNALKRHDFARELAQIQRQQGLLQMLKTPREVKRECIKLLDMLGKGHFGQVYKGTVQEKSNPEYLVAVKTLVTDASEEHQRDLLYEAALMAQLEHDNVVSLVAVCTLAPQPLLLLQFCEHGSLLSFLQRRTGFDSLTLSARLSVALDCARGMRYLHSLDIVHRDLAARNVLVASDYTCKISDFGLSRELNDSEYYKVSANSCLPIKWSALEVLENSRYTPLSDVWSFGILLHEVFANGESPYKNMSNEQVIVRVKAGYRLGRARECPESLYALQRRCWDQDPKNRPLMEEIVTELHAQTRACDAEGTERGSTSHSDHASVSIDMRRAMRFGSRREKRPSVSSPSTGQPPSQILVANEYDITPSEYSGREQQVVDVPSYEYDNHDTYTDPLHQTATQRDVSHPDYEYQEHAQVVLRAKAAARAVLEDPDLLGESRSSQAYDNNQDPLYGPVIVPNDYKQVAAIQTLQVPDMRPRTNSGGNTRPRLNAPPVPMPSALPAAPLAPILEREPSIISICDSKVDDVEIYTVRPPSPGATPSCVPLPASTTAGCVTPIPLSSAPAPPPPQGTGSLTTTTHASLLPATISAADAMLARCAPQATPADSRSAFMW
eukprot:m.203285 g.203285  ORF g.203285 m.203285 type:complete len:1054 (-) comp15520_c0_seq1:17-3178(-)